MAKAVTTYTFEAAHWLPNHAGQCAKMHGHSYRLEVEVQGPIKAALQPSGEQGGSDEGMVMDFGAIKPVIRQWIIDKLDHSCLNELFSFRPTAENLALWCLRELNAHLDVPTVRLWETVTAYVEVSRDDL